MTQYTLTRTPNYAPSNVDQWLRAYGWVPDGDAWYKPTLDFERRTWSEAVAIEMIRVLSVGNG